MQATYFQECKNTLILDYVLIQANTKIGGEKIILIDVKGKLHVFNYVYK